MSRDRGRNTGTGTGRGRGRGRGGDAIHTRFESTRAGLGYALLAYGFWGVVPAFWKLLGHVPASELLAHRVVWGLLCFGTWLFVRGRGEALRRALSERRTALVLLLSAALLATNWGVFIYAIETNRVLHVSLGYFINPLLSAFLGMVVLRERLRAMQWVGLVLAAIGVAQFALRVEAFPWIAIALACSFGLYGLIRKTAPVDALPGSTLEALFMLPFAVGYLAVLASTGEEHFLSSGPATQLLLATTGLVTMLPLLWFANAARRLPLTTLGFVQYIAPSAQLALAVLVYHEPFRAVELRGFACIWAALVLVSLESRWRARRRAHSGVQMPVPSGE